MGTGGGWRIQGKFRIDGNGNNVTGYTVVFVSQISQDTKFQRTTTIHVLLLLIDYHNTNLLLLLIYQ